MEAGNGNESTYYAVSENEPVGPTQVTSPKTPRTSYSRVPPGSPQPASLSSVLKHPLGGYIVAVVLYVLLQFNIIGPGADAKNREMSEKFVRIEARLDAIEAHLTTRRQEIVDLLKPMETQMCAISKQMDDLNRMVERHIMMESQMFMKPKAQGGAQ